MNDGWVADFSANLCNCSTPLRHTIEKNSSRSWNATLISKHLKITKKENHMKQSTNSRINGMVASQRMARLSRISAVFLAVLHLGFPSLASAQGAINEILGDAIIECRGAIAWRDSPEATTPRIEALQIASAAIDAADRILVYAAEKDTTPEDFLTCNSGICTVHRVTETGATTSVMRLSRGLDYGSGRVQYDLDAAFTIVSFSSGSMVAETITGRGGFVCDAALPASVAMGG